MNAANTKTTPRKVPSYVTVGEGTERITIPYCKKNKVFYGDMSEYERFLLATRVAGRDTTRIELTSSATGNVAVFVGARDERDAEGELLSVVFAPTEQTVRNNPGLRGVCVRLFND